MFQSKVSYKVGENPTNYSLNDAYLKVPNMFAMLINCKYAFRTGSPSYKVSVWSISEGDKSRDEQHSYSEPVLKTDTSRHPTPEVWGSI